MTPKLTPHRNGTRSFESVGAKRRYFAPTASSHSCCLLMGIRAAPLTPPKKRVEPGKPNARPPRAETLKDKFNGQGTPTFAKSSLGASSWGLGSHLEESSNTLTSLGRFAV